jgi:hypothetical protein
VVELVLFDEAGVDLFDGVLEGSGAEVGLELMWGVRLEPGLGEWWGFWDGGRGRGVDVDVEASRADGFEDCVRLGCGKDEYGLGRGLFEGFEEGVCGCGLALAEAIGIEDEGDFVIGFEGLEVDFVF